MPEDDYEKTMRQRKVEFADTQRRNAKTNEIEEMDLPIDACRIYLQGSNHPYMAMGGPWKLPSHESPSTAVCLRLIIKRKQYREFAEMLTKKLHFSMCSLEYLWFCIVGFFFPPFAAVTVTMVVFSF